MVAGTGRAQVAGHELWTLALGVAAGAACGFLNTAAAAGSAVSLPILMLIGLDPITANATNRIPVLIGAITGTAAFHAKKVLPWNFAVKVSIPATLGSLLGAWLSEHVTMRDLGLIMTAAVLIALVLVSGKLRKAIEQASAREPRFGLTEAAILFGIGVWTGFIMIDGVIYLLMALTLLVGLPFIAANAVKTAVSVPTLAVPLVVYLFQGSIDWTIGAVLAAGSVVGAYFGARLATSPAAKRYVYALLVTVLSAELLDLAWHFFFKTV
jgi:uncharacterized protein